MAINFVKSAGMACRYMAAFHGVIDQALVRGGEWVVVHGCGGMGLSAVQIAVALESGATEEEIRQWEAAGALT